MIQNLKHIILLKSNNLHIQFGHYLVKLILMSLVLSMQVGEEEMD